MEGKSGEQEPVGTGSATKVARGIELRERNPKGTLIISGEQLGNGELVMTEC